MNFRLKSDMCTLIMSELVDLILYNVQQRSKCAFVSNITERSVSLYIHIYILVYYSDNSNGLTWLES